MTEVKNEDIDSIIDEDEDIDSTIDEDEDEDLDEDEVPEPLKRKDDESDEDYQSRLVKTAKSNYARAVKAEKASKANKPTKTVKKEINTETKTKNELSLDTVLDLQEKGFGPGDIRKLQQKAENLGVTVDKLASDEDYLSSFQAKIEKDKTKKDFDNKTPSSRGRSSTISEIGKKPLKQMSKDEKQSAFDKKFNKK